MLNQDGWDDVLGVSLVGWEYPLCDVLVPCWGRFRGERGSCLMEGMSEMGPPTKQPRQSDKGQGRLDC